MNNFNRNSGFNRQRKFSPAIKKNDNYSKDTQEKSSSAELPLSDRRSPKRPPAANQLDNLVNTASKQLNTSPEELKNAAQNGNMQKLFSQMSPSQAQQLQKILSDENAAKKLLSTPQAQALLRGISKNE